MAGPIVYVDRSDVTPGSLTDLQTAVSELVAFVEAREPRLIAYGFYIDDVGSAMTVVAVHPDSASLEFHLSTGGPEFRKVGAFIRLRAIEVFGQPSDIALEQLKEKARMLGDATVVVRSADAGFARTPTAMEAPKHRA
jgi:hypothetical protein